MQYEETEERKVGSITLKANNQKNARKRKHVQVCFEHM